MQQLVSTPIDHKNIKLAKLIYTLRQELDIYWLININTDNLFNQNQSGVGKKFYSFLRNLAISSITLSICKIYEHENRYELNSICGIISHLRKESAVPLNSSIFEAFIKKYNGPSAGGSLMDLLNLTFNNFQQKYENELDQFKIFRNKYAAHSEYGFPISTLPSYDVMEKLFLFASDFCELIYRQFIGVGIVNLDGRDIKNSFIGILEELGHKDIKTEIQ